MSTRKMKPVRIMGIRDADALYVACDPDMPVKEVVAELESLDPQFIFDEALRDDILTPPLLFRVHDLYHVPEFVRYIPTNGKRISSYSYLPSESEEVSSDLRQASGPGRGAFFVRFFDIGEAWEND